MALLRTVVTASALFWSCLPAIERSVLPPTHEATLQCVPKIGFAEKPLQIPATVIDVGILKNVPYLSYRIGANRELNVYGGPEAPACIEIGLYRSLLNSNTEKQRCFKFLRDLFPALDFSSAKPNGGKALSGNWVIEVTMPDAPDAYGGWWISVYNLERLHQAAGTSANISTVSESPSSATDWTPQQLTYARPSTAAPSSSSYSSSSSNSTGRVYVKSYYRKDGTYVRSHSRRK